MSATVKIEFVTDYPLSMVMDWPRMLGLLGPMDLAVRNIECEVLAGPGPEPTIGDLPEPAPMSPTFDADDPSQLHSDRVLQAVNAAYKGESYQPRVVVVIEYPASGDRDAPASDGRVAIASTGTDALDTHRMLSLGIGAVKRAARAEARRN